MSECGHDRCAGFDPATADLCKFPGCTRRWTVEVEAEDGWSAFLCDEHFDQVDVDVPDPVHGRIVSASGTWGLERVAAAVSSRPGSGRKARRKAQRQSRRRNRR